MYFYSHHIGDYLSDAASLSLLEHGVYLRLSQEYHKNEAPLFGDIPRKIGAKTKEEMRAVAYVLENYFKCVDGKYHNTKFDETIAAYKANAERSRFNGRLGGRPKKNNPAGSVTKPSAKATKNQKPLTKNQKPVTKKPRSPVKTCATATASL